ncbi:glycosyltransferase [Oscillatoria sp. FACHB-1406]|nr:glycosyltransferase [Oscillatoria sp. FACHB-1406]
MAVSVIIPAHNAAATLAETLESLLAQTYPHWEAIVVDDGSKDDTAAIAAQFAARDGRIRTKRQLQAGVCNARNTGILLAQYDWLLFLDSDDWLAPEQLEKMTQKLRENPDLDGIHCGWARVTPDGQEIGESYWHQADNLFPALAQTCAFTIHACVIRRSLVETVGGFDPSFRTCEDWDMWQRLARVGARFDRLPEVLVYYRMRPDSASIDAFQMFADALRVIERGHSSDPRISNPLPAHANGQPLEELARAKLQWLCWSAGLLVGSGTDPLPLLELVRQDSDPSLDPYHVAYTIFKAAILPTCQTFDAWERLAAEWMPSILDFLNALEVQSRTLGLARRSANILEQLILQRARIANPLTIGKTYAARVEVTEPILALAPPASAERFYCVVEMEGTELGRLELPICDGTVSTWVLKDAIAAQFYWQILGRFFEQTVYTEQDRAYHDQIGWTVFLQQLWGLDWPSDRFYDSELSEPTATNISIESNERRVEVSEELCDLVVPGSELKAIFTVGGVAIAQLTIPAIDNLVTAQALRVAITTAGGLELCRACVREGLIGQSWNEPTSLRSRLALAAQTHDAEPVKHSKVLLARRPGLSGSVNRRAVLPSETVEDLLAMARVTKEAILDSSSLTEGLESPIYDPGAIAASGANLESVSQQSPLSSLPETSANTAQIYGLEHFETLFASRADPWKYTSPYEQTKYEQTLSLLPSTPIHKALEIACAEGHFTAQLAPRVETLLATDLSQIALDRTTQRCSHLNNICFQKLDLTKDSIPGKFNLIVCSEVLYYVESLKVLEEVAGKFTDALESGGYLLVAHAHQIIDEPDKPGYDWGLSFGAKAIGDTFARQPLLSLAKEIWTPLYRVQLFQRQPWQHSTPEIIKLEQQPTPAPPEVEATVRWQGGQPSESIVPAPVTTEKLPVLMYHRVAPTGSAATARWRVTPEVFEEQLRYLRDAGFYSVSWEAWQAAADARRALPGRAIAITFDDGYQDFFEYAWPLLKKYGFTATVFIVAERAGDSNRWDSAYGEDLPLMGWSEIRQLREQGVIFGSHSATHQPLTALSVAEVVKEAARSRTIISRELGEAINTFAYPYGDFDPVVEHLIGACGYTFGLSCRSGACRFQDSLLAIPRIEVMGSDSFQEFVAKIGAPPY